LLAAVGSEQTIWQERAQPVSVTANAAHWTVSAIAACAFMAAVVTMADLRVFSVTFTDLGDDDIMQGAWG